MASAHRSVPLAALAKQFLEVAGQSEGQLSGVLRELGLSRTEGGTLWALAEASEPVPMREIAARLGCDPSNVTVIGDKLEAAGLVDRQVHPRDSRARVLALTPAGRALWADIEGRLARDSAVASLTAADRRELQRLLGIMQARA